MAINRKGTITASTQRACVGSLAAHLDKFAEFLVGEGYVSETIKAKYALVADLSHWLKQRGVPLAKLDETRLKQFHAHRRGSKRRGDVSTGHQLLELLRRLGVVPALPQKVDQTALGQLTRDYERFLRSERGLAPATLISYLPIVRRFLTRISGTRRFAFRSCGRRTCIGSFFASSAGQPHLFQAHGHGTALVPTLLVPARSTKTDLASALFGVANWRLSHLPKSLPSEQVERLLRCCDRSTATGKRDYAILLLLARLGLRGGEVLAMTLEDLDWERGEIIVRGKGQRLERLPLPKDVGTALACYLRRGPSGVCDTPGLHPHEGPAPRPSPALYLLHRSSRPPARRIEPRFQRGAPVATLSGHQAASPRCVSG